jgi:hypothetical protein
MLDWQKTQREISKHSFAGLQPHLSLVLFLPDFSYLYLLLSIFLFILRVPLAFASWNRTLGKDLACSHSSSLCMIETLKHSFAGLQPHLSLVLFLPDLRSSVFTYAIYTKS